MHVRIHLDDGPELKHTLADFLIGRTAPPQVTTLRSRKVFCLKTGKFFRIRNDNQILLVPLTIDGNVAEN